MSLSDFESADAGVDEDDLEQLTEAEREVYESTVLGEYGVREYGRETDRRPGTVGNLLARARETLGGDEDDV
ncbi:sigma factor-like helix-turn-helix DNA-binding protein [Natrinema versiforme]|uniref:Sigma-70 family RNA polymerase sigma factor n=2 Tax=root TaxID=1 RepID=A0A4P8WNC9_9EURY|nr:sigma-70 region 4 domain-containing protein [Natrinema versiforme]YP_010772672.1 sigma-70 family RNA polymerase sigma factor [Natrinema versiforme icosahedral virus 1]QCS45128.1 sigma-70 family RNA polymerase sigma factor [Natrinema versiforme]DAC85256.1 TPA_asm: sigma-70 family RNA polymerase sigma factor [Natrinema versiforme icosahedral virus 1]